MPLKSNLAVWPLLQAAVVLVALAFPGKGAASTQSQDTSNLTPAQKRTHDIAYGGVLPTFHTPVQSSDEDIALAVDAAMEYLQELEQATGGLNANLPPPRIRFASRHILEYTRDGSTPYVMHMRDHYGRIHRRTVIMGITYQFDLEWEIYSHGGWHSRHMLSPTIPYSSTCLQCTKGCVLSHSFTVTRDRNNAHSILSHTSHLQASYDKLHYHNGRKGRSRPEHAVLTPDGWKEAVISKDGGRETLTEGERPVPRVYAKRLLKHNRGHIGRIIHLDHHLHRGDEGTTVHIDALGMYPRMLTTTAFDGMRCLHWNQRRSWQPLRVLTYNIWNTNGKDKGWYPDRMRALAEDVRKTSADIWAAQEVRHDVLRDSQVSRLLDLLPEYNVAFQPAMSYPEQVWHRVEEGVAVFSRFPITSTHYILLPRDDTPQGANVDVHQRILLHVTIDTPQLGSVNVLTSHFSLSERGRNLTVLRIREYVETLSGPTFLLGDLNAEPDSPAMRFLAGQQDIEGTKPLEGMADAWLLLHPEPRKGASYEDENEPRDNGLTFNALDDHLCKRIDYCFVYMPGCHSSDWTRHLCLQDDAEAESVAQSFSKQLSCDADSSSSQHGSTSGTCPLLLSAAVVGTRTEAYPSSDHVGVLFEFAAPIQ